MQLPVGFRIVPEATPFDEAVAALVRRVPPGSVASYGDVARWIGRPGAHRAVGNALAKGLDTPAHRVVGAGGRLTRGWPEEQARRLRAEGVAVRDGRLLAPVAWWDGPGDAAL